MFIIADLMSVVVDHGGDVILFYLRKYVSSKSKSKNILSEVKFFSSSVHCPYIDLDVRFSSQLITFYRILILKSLQCFPALCLILVTF